MRKHRSHLIASILGGSVSVVERSVLLTQLTAAISSIANTAGIYWGAGTVVNSKEKFIELTKGMDTNNYPVQLWIDFRVEKKGDNGYTLFTTGMNALGHKEIEIQKPYRDDTEIYKLAYYLANYLLMNGPVVKEGHTIGLIDDRKKIKIEYDYSMYDEDKEVMVINMEKSEYYH